jgi:nucleoside-diphosphate-sugar epimerase
MHAFIFGFGYVGEAFARVLLAKGWSVAASARRDETGERLQSLGITPVHPADPAAMTEAVAKATAILVTAPPGADGCPGLAALVPAIARAGAYPDWIGYLSTTGVYGDRDGGWVDEGSVLNAQSPEGGRRVAAERDWRQTARGMGLTVVTFRLPGIYGPGKSAIDRLRDGTAKRIAKPGHVFSRAHRDDIVSALFASLARPRAAAIYNICDDEPAPGEAVVAYAAALLGVEPPSLTTDVSKAAYRFYAENKRVSNARATAELGWRPAYPTYREGLAAVLKTLDTSPPRS